MAQKARLQPSQLTFVVAPTASLAGGVQISARILETGLHKMETLGFDVRRVVSGMGTAPIPPVAKNDLRAIGRTNDCILYGGQARYTVRAGDAELAELARKVPASASRDYGTPFYDIFQRYEGDFYKIDPLLFSPGRGLADEHGDRTDVPRGAPESRGADRVVLPELTDPSTPIQERAMRRFPSWLVPSLALAAACSKPADKAAEAPAGRHRRRPRRPRRPARRRS